MLQTDEINNIIYKELSIILTGCDTFIDILPFASDYLHKYPHKKDIITCIINKKNFYDTMDIGTKRECLNDALLCESRNSINKLIEQSSHSSDIAYKNALNRLANCKKTENKYKNITKKCPHCGQHVTLLSSTTYVICGYHDINNGYDWIGCGHDWCFYCEKMLCKKWHENALHCGLNKIHDNKCCLQHSIENGNKYPDDYCQCTNMHVNRADNLTSNIEKLNLTMLNAYAILDELKNDSI